MSKEEFAVLAEKYMDTEYMTIKRFDDGVRYAMSPHNYVQAAELDY